MSEHPKHPNHLRLVTDEPPPPRPPRPRRRADLAPEQRIRLANAIRGLRLKYSTYKRIAEAMGFTTAALSQVLGGRGGSHTMAARVAHLAGVPVETILYGGVFATDRCPTCGQKKVEEKS